MPWNINSHNVLMNHIFYNSLNSQVHTGYVGKIVFIDKNNNYHNITWSPNHEVNDWVYTYKNRTNLYHYKNGQGTCRICGWNNIYTSTSESHHKKETYSQSVINSVAHYNNLLATCNNLGCDYRYTSSQSEGHSWYNSIGSWTYKNETDHWRKITNACTKCTYSSSYYENQNHNYREVNNANQVTYINEFNHGIKANFRCNACNNVVMRFIGITQHRGVVHEYGDAWEYNDTHHWKNDNYYCHNNSNNSDHYNYCWSYYNVKNHLGTHSWDNRQNCSVCGADNPNWHRP